MHLKLDRQVERLRGALRCDLRRQSLAQHAPSPFLYRARIKGCPPTARSARFVAAPPQGCPIDFFAPRAVPSTVAAVSKRSARRDSVSWQRFTIVRLYEPWHAPASPCLLKQSKMRAFAHDPCPISAATWPISVATMLDPRGA